MIEQKIKIGQKLDTLPSDCVVFGNTLMTIMKGAKNYLVIAVYDGNHWHVRSKEEVAFELAYKVGRINREVLEIVNAEARS